MKRRESGFTLLEVLVAGALGLMLLGLLHQFLVPIIETSSRVTAEEHLTDQGLLVLSRLSSELAESTPGSLSFSGPETNQRRVVGVTRRDGVSAEGRKLWRKEASVYFWDQQSGQVRWRSWPPAPPDFGLIPRVDRPLVFSSDELNTLSNTVGGSKLLASDVIEFQPFVDWPPTYSVTSRIVLEQKLPWERDAHCEWSRVTAFKN